MVNRIEPCMGNNPLKAGVSIKPFSNLHEIVNVNSAYNKLNITESLDKSQSFELLFFGSPVRGDLYVKIEVYLRIE